MRSRIRFSAPLRTRIGASGAALAALIIGGGWVAHDAWKLLALHTDIQDTQQALSRLESSRRDAMAPVNELHPVSKVQREAVNQAVRRLNLPWSQVLDALEDAAGQQVSVTSIEPDADKRTLQIGAEVKSPMKMLDFVSSLKRHTAFEQVMLKRHEMVTTGDSRPTKFVLTVVWRETLETR